MKKKKKLKKLGTLAIGATLAVSCVLSPIAAAEETTGETETTTISQEENTTVQSDVQTTVSGIEETTTGQTEQETTTSDDAQTTEPEPEENTTNPDTENVPDATQQLDKTDLQAKIDEALALIDSEPNCEDELIWDVQSCIALARVAINDPDATQEEIDEAYELLQNAMDIITGGPEIPPLTKDDLSALISQVQPYVSMSDKFTEESFNDFIAAFTSAQAVFNEPQATADDIDNAYGELQYTYYWLEILEATDKSDLYSLVWQVEVLLDEADSSWLTPESYQRVDNAFTNAQKVLDDVLATQDEIDAAAQELSDAVEAVKLTQEGRNAIVMLVINDVESQIDGPLMYTPGSWQAYTDAKAALEALLKNPNVQEEDFAIAIEEYYMAANGLNHTAENTNKAYLKELMGQAEYIFEYDVNYYTEDSIQALRDAYGRAQQTYQDNTATSQVVAVNELELYTAMDELVFTQNGARNFLDELSTTIDDIITQGIFDQVYMNDMKAYAEEIEALFEDFDGNYYEIQYGLYDLRNMLYDIPFSLDYLYSVLDEDLTFCEDIIAANQDYDMGDRKYYYYDYFMEIYNTVAAIRDSGYENEDYDTLLNYAQEFITIFNTFFSLRDEAFQMLTQANDAVECAGKYTQESLSVVKAAIPALTTVLDKGPDVILELRVAYEDMYDALQGLELSYEEPTTGEETTTEEPTTGEETTVEEPTTGEETTTEEPTTGEETTVEEPTTGEEPTTEKTTTKPSDNPKTGDDRNLFPIGLTGSVSLAVMGAMVLLKKKKAGENE